MPTAATDNSSTELPARQLVLSLLLTLVVLVAAQAILFWILLLLRATIYQRQLSLLLFIFGLIYPAIQFGAMWAVIGPGRLAVRQLVALACLVVFMGLAILVSYAMSQFFLLDFTWSSFIQQPIGGGRGFNWIRFGDDVTITRALVVYWSAVPALFLVCQVPYWIWSACAWRPQLVRNSYRPRQPLRIADLLFLTALTAIAFSGISFSIANSNVNSNTDDVVGLLFAIVSQLIYACLSFVVVCWPGIIITLKGKDASKRKILDTRRVGYFVGYLLLLILLLSFGWAVWNNFLVHWSLLFIVAIPFATLGLPFGLLLLQLKRFGFRLETQGR